jgi:hypothetical protein
MQLPGDLIFHAPVTVDTDHSSPPRDYASPRVSPDVYRRRSFGLRAATGVVSDEIRRATLIGSAARDRAALQQLTPPLPVRLLLL